MDRLDGYLLSMHVRHEMKAHADAMGTMTCGGMWIESGGGLAGNEGPLATLRLNRKQRRAMKAIAR
jgi:hypothetical protein